MASKKNQRRNAFEGWGEAGSPSAPEGEPRPPSPLDLIPKAEPRQRNRDYEKRNRTFTYRLTDAELGGKIAAVAASIQVTVDEVARAFAEAGIRAANANSIPFGDVPPTQRRLTLYPTGNETWAVQEQPGWQKVIPPREKKKPLTETEKRRRQKELNQFRVSYRWPAEIDQAIVKLTEKVVGKATTRSDGRKGWVLTILLRYGLSTYEAGRLPLNPEPKTVKMRLTW